LDRRCAGGREEALVVSIMGECAGGDADGNADGTMDAERIGTGVADDDEQEEEEREAGSVFVLFDG
jgi:hypothetical protein